MSEPNEHSSPITPDTTPDDQKPGITRRLFLRRSGAAVASTGAATVGSVAALNAPSAAAQEASPVPGSGLEDRVGTEAYQFFNLHEAATVDAIASRILPGTPDDPGAHEAGAVYFIDSALAGSNEGLTRKTYMQGPFSVAASEEPVSVEAASTRDIYEYVSVPQELISRFGYQSVLTPQEVYRRGLEFIDAYAQSEFEANFVDLSADQQDEILTAMDEDTATGFEGPSPRAFFTQLRNDTIEGTFCDPMYGGNRDMIGWKLIGFPGAQRFYTPEEIKDPEFQREPQSLAMLMAHEGH